MLQRRLLMLIGIAVALLVVGASAVAYLLTPHGGGMVSDTTTSQRTATPAVTISSGCGAKKNNDGTYRFSWLHVSPQGQVVDEKNCVVPLVGFNMGALFLGNAGGNTTFAKLQWYKQNFPMNVVRVNFNSRWWVDNVYVPDAKMNFRDWLQTYVKWHEELGNYVMLDKGPHFAEPPCQTGSKIACPNQDEGKRDYQKSPNVETAKALEDYIGYDVQAWTDIAKLYANDPAILYDAWNEPTLKDLPIFFQDMNTLINTIRMQNPNALVIVYQRGYSNIMKSGFPNYTQPNLVIDAHVYPKFNGVSPATKQMCHSPGTDGWTPESSSLNALVQFAHSHGQAFILNEWGGCYDVPQYHQLITSYAKQQGVGLVYFQASNVVADPKASPLQVNSNGTQVKAAYADILGVR